MSRQGHKKIRYYRTVSPGKEHRAVSSQFHSEVPTISPDQCIENIFRLVATAAGKTIDSKMCALWLLDEDHKTLKLRITRGIADGCPCNRSLRIGQGTQGTVAMTKAPMSVTNLSGDFPHTVHQTAARADPASLLSVPMLTEDQLIGVIDFYTAQPHEFTERDKHVLSVVADAAARAIANTESMIKSPVIREELESRKLIEQAKAILVAHRGLNGAGAHRWIRERSMATQKSAREVAAAVLLTEETPLSVPF